MVAIVIHLETQTLELVGDDGAVIRRNACPPARMAPARRGGSLRTPRAATWCARASAPAKPLGAVFKGRRPTGEVWSPAGGPTRGATGSSPVSCGWPAASRA